MTQAFIKSEALKSRKLFAGLALADGSVWRIVAGHEQTSFLVSRLASIMRLGILQDTSSSFETERVKPLSDDRVTSLCVSFGDQRADESSSKKAFHVQACGGTAVSQSCGSEQNVPISYPGGSCRNEEVITCILRPPKNDTVSVILLMHLSMIIAQQSEVRGGVLIHGALLEKKGYGVILAGPGDAGKTTASRRLPTDWHSLCDDTTLVICDNQGRYWGHPWPTWSNLMLHGSCESWDVQHAVKLKSIFFLEKAGEEQILPLGTSQAICLLTESAEQVSRLMSRWLEKDEARMLRLQRFENICSLAQAVPSYILRLSRHGTFWQDVEEALKRER